jgi:hypothetical protein
MQRGVGGLSERTRRYERALLSQIQQWQAARVPPRAVPETGTLSPQRMGVLLQYESANSPDLVEGFPVSSGWSSGVTPLPAAVQAGPLPGCRRGRNRCGLRVDHRQLRAVPAWPLYSAASAARVEPGRVDRTGPRPWSAGLGRHRPSRMLAPTTRPSTDLRPRTLVRNRGPPGRRRAAGRRPGSGCSSLEQRSRINSSPPWRNGPGPPGRTAASSRPAERRRKHLGRRCRAPVAVSF